jgi:hypothetical protein
LIVNNSLNVPAFGDQDIREQFIDITAGGNYERGLL